MNGFKPNAKMGNTCHYSHGGAVMKKAKGGVARGEGTDDEESGTLRMEKMPSGAQQYVRGSTRGEKAKTLSKYARGEINKLNPTTDDNDEWDKQYKKVKALHVAGDDNFDAWDKDKEDSYKTGGKIMKKANGGAMKQAAIDKAKQVYQTQVRRNPRDTGVALGPDDRPLGMPTKPKCGGVMGSPVKPKCGMMGNGPFGPRNPNGPRKPMPGMSVAGPVLSSMFKGPMARKKGGMAKGMK
jgi:hypothetical protein